MILCTLISVDNKKFNKLTIENEKQANNLKQQILNSDFVVDNIVTREKKVSLFSLFKLFTLQDASSKLGFSQNIQIL